MSVLLIHPPLVKPCEPPPGLARLAAALRAGGVGCRIVDANIEGLLELAGRPLAPQDTWTRRALKNRDANLRLLRSPAALESFDRYGRAVCDTSRLLGAQAGCFGAMVSLADYAQTDASPVSSAGLAAAAAHPEGNPFYPYFKRRLLELMAEREPRIIGLSVNFLSQALTAAAMLGFLRAAGSRALLVVGGGLITTWRSRPGLPEPFAGLADHCIAGPGEGELGRLAGANASPQPAAPDYSDLPLDEYLSPARVLPFSASAGCYWSRCSFCPERAEGALYQPLPAASARAQLQSLVRRYRPGLLHLVDNALSPALLKELCRKPPGAPWYGFARVSDELQDEGFCRGLRAAGCVMLQLGLESGDDEVLAALHKGITTADSARALAALQGAGIGAYVYLLFGTPAETPEAARRTLTFAAKMHERIDFLNLAIFNMPVHAPEAAALGTGVFFEGDLALYTAFRHPRGWQRGTVRRFLDREFRRHPAIAPILRCDPPFFTSNHAPFFCRVEP